MRFVLADTKFNVEINSTFFDVSAIQALAERLAGQGEKGWIAIVGRHPADDRLIAIGSAPEFPYIVRALDGVRTLCEYDVVSAVHAGLTVERMLRNAPDARIEVVPTEVQG